MNALAKILEWPVEPQDELGLALWDAVSLARAMDGVAVGEFQVAGVEIDSRDVIARIEELEAERDEYEAARAESTAMMLSWEQQNEDEAAELAEYLRNQGVAPHIIRARMAEVRGQPVGGAVDLFRPLR